MKIQATLAALALAAVGLSQTETTYNYAQVDGLKVFYREAGPKDAKTIVLLHGFPSSSHMFRELIPRLAKKVHVIAPDYVGYGYSDAPTNFKYTFDNLEKVVDDLLVQKGVNRYSLYLQDYGGPVGFRLAAAHPERVQGLVIQNSNAYVEGISKLATDALAHYAEKHTQDPELEKTVQFLFSYDGIKFGYTQGSPNPAAISPDSYTFDNALFQAKPNNLDIQTQLISDYASNVALYDSWHAYFRKYQPKALVLWGKGDPFFTVEGGKAFARDLKHVDYHLYDAGHFALEEKGPEFADRILKFLGGL